MPRNYIILSDPSLKSSRSSTSSPMSSEADEKTRRQSRISEIDYELDQHQPYIVKPFVPVDPQSLVIEKVQTISSRTTSLSSEPHSATSFCINWEELSSLHYIHQGQHTRVYQCQHDHKPVVLKILSPASEKNVTAFSNMETEIAILSHIKHPNVINLLGFGAQSLRTCIKGSVNDSGSSSSSTSIRPFLVLEALTGGTLRKQLDNRACTPFTVHRYLRMARELASALEYLHKQAKPDGCIIHRGVRPENIGFAADGSVKLLDFARSVEVNRSDAVSGMYSLKGGMDVSIAVLRYMAPEVALEKPYNEQADMFSFGLVLYELMAGMGAFAARTKDQFLAQVIQGGQRPSLEYDRLGREIRTPKEIQALVGICWEGDPWRRPSASMAERILAEAEQGASRREQEKGFLAKCFDTLTRTRDTV